MAAAAFLILLGTLVVFTFDPCLGLTGDSVDFLLESGLSPRDRTQQETRASFT